MESSRVETSSEESVSELAKLGSRVHLFDVKSKSLERKLPTHRPFSVTSFSCSTAAFMRSGCIWNVFWSPGDATGSWS
jgi:hypothetical protein